MHNKQHNAAAILARWGHTTRSSPPHCPNVDEGKGSEGKVWQRAKQDARHDAEQGTEEDYLPAIQPHGSDPHVMTRPMVGRGRI